MNIIINDQKYNITWKYYGPTTECRIKHCPTGLVIFGKTNRFHKDQPDKEIARKNSLANALNNGKFSKEHREIFWGYYFARGSSGFNELSFQDWYEQL